MRLLMKAVYKKHEPLLFFSLRLKKPWVFTYISYVVFHKLLILSQAQFLIYKMDNNI